MSSKLSAVEKARIETLEQHIFYRIDQLKKRIDAMKSKTSSTLPRFIDAVERKRASNE